MPEWSVFETAAIASLIISCGAVSYLYYSEEKRWHIHIFPYIFYGATIIFSYLHAGKFDFEFMAVILGVLIFMHAAMIYNNFFKK